jgi:hypothetical protein
VRQGPQDFDPLAVADRQSTDNLVGREIVDFNFVSAPAISGSPSMTPRGPIEIALINMTRAE